MLNKKKRIFSVLLGLIVALAMVISSCDAVTGASGDTDGYMALSASRAGVEQTVITNQAGLQTINSTRAGVEQTVITNQAGLQAINSTPTGNYVLGASFTVTNWIPICDPSIGGNPFTGSLDGGKNYTITVQSFDSRSLANNDYIGIFATTQGASISNLTVNYATGSGGGVSISTGASTVGGIVAYAAGTTFDTVTVNGSLDVEASTGADTDFYAGLVAGDAEEGTTFINTNIEASFNVLYTSDYTNTVHAGGIVGYMVNSKMGGATIDGLFTLTADMPYDYVPDNSARFGGAAGYAEQAGFDGVTVDASAAVNANSQQTQVYVGGVVGKGLTVTITGANSSAVITGNGYGYNTSAGGVAGYIQQSAVSESSASGAVTLGARWDGTLNSIWQIYAGGLVGYSGGTANGGSSITQSHATGAVSATSTYPYAGGLVGYNYGYNDFSGSPAEYAEFLAAGGVSATSNGGQITRSYATGNVQAISISGTNGLPYAGGLVGYSSIPAIQDTKIVPNIENCYAKGNVIATTDSMFAWAGGLLGANAQGSLVSKTYAIGTVDVKAGINKLPYDQPGTIPGAAGGGIVGMNYYVDVTSGKAPLVTLSVGLNTLILGSSQDTSVAPYLLQRVAGSLGPNNPLYLGTLINNFGNDSMLIVPVWNQDIGPNGLDGDNSAAQPPQSFFVAAPLNWDFGGIWTMGADGYPALR